MPEFAFRWGLLLLILYSSVVVAADPAVEPVTASDQTRTTGEATSEQSQPDSPKPPDTSDQAQAAKPSKSDEQIEAGKKLFRASKFDQASAIFNSVLEAEPDNPQAYYWLGQIDLKHGRVQEGIRKIIRSTELAPDNALLWQTLGQVYEENELYGQAEAAYNKAVEVNPKLLLARLSLALFHERRKHLETALDMYVDLIINNTGSREAAVALKRVVDLYPPVIDAMIKRIQSDKVLTEEEIDRIAKRAQLLISRGQFDMAIQFLQPLAERYPDNPKGHYWLGQAYVGKNDYVKGAVSLSRSLELAPENNALREQLLNAYLRNGDTDRAEKLLAEIEASDPKYKNLNIIKRNVSLNKATKLEKEGNIEAAIQEYKSIQLLFPKEPIILVGLIRLYEKQDQPGLANQLIRELLEYQPDNVAVRRMLVDFYKERDDDAAARKEALKVLELSKNEADRRFVLDYLGFQKGIDFMKQGKFPQALNAFDEIEKVAPDEVLVLMNVGIIYQKQRKYTDAIDTFKHAIEVEPNAASAYVKLGEIYEQIEDYEQAINNYDKAADIGKGTAVGQKANKNLAAMERQIITLGRKKLDNGEISDAEKLFSGIVERNPDSAQGRFWLSKVLLKKKDVEAGMSGIERSAAMAPYNWQMQRELGKTYREAKLYKKSLEAYKRAYELAPDQHSLLLEIALLNQLLGDQDGFHAGLQEYLAAEKETENRIKALDLLGYSAARETLQGGDYQSALNALEPIYKIVPEEPLVLSALSEAYHQKGMFKQAEEYINQASVIEPNNGDLKYQHAVLLKETGQVDKALALVEKALASKQLTKGEEARALYDELHQMQADRMLAVVKAHRHLSQEDQSLVTETGMTMVRKKAYEPAIQFLAPAARKAKDNPELYYWLGEAYFDNGDQKEGIKNIKRSFDLAPDNDKLLMELGRLYSKAGEDDEAVTIYEEMIARDTKEMAVYPRLVEIYVNRGDRENAGKTMQKFNLTPGHEGLKTTALNVLGLSDAISLAKDKRYGEAEQILNELVTVAPDHPLVIRTAALVKMELKEYADAERLFKRLIEVSPGDYTGYRALAEIYIRSDRHEEALQVYEQAKNRIKTRQESADLSRQLITLYKDDARDYLRDTSDSQLARSDVVEHGIGKARNLVQMGQYTLAENLLDRILVSDPDNPQANYWQGKVYLNTKRADKGLTLIEKSVRLTPDNKRLKWELGKSYETAGRWQDALDMYMAVEDVIKEAKPREYLLRARMDQSRKQYDSAIREYRKYLDLKQGDDQAIEFKIASIYETQGAYGKADKIYEGLIARKPDDTSLRNKVIAIYDKRGDQAAVKRHALAVLARKNSGPDRKYALDKLGFSDVREQLKKGDYDNAINGLNALLEVVPDEVDVMLTLAIIYKRKGDLAQSESQYRKILAVDPENSGAYLGLGGLYLLQGDKTEAIPYFEKASEYGGNSPNAKTARKAISRIDMERARTLASQNRTREAIARLEHLLQYDTNNNAARDYLGTLYANVGENDKSIELFERVVKQNPQRLHGWVALQKLYERKNDLDKSIDAQAHAISLQKDPEQADVMAEALSILVVKKLFNENELLLAFRELERLKTDSPDSVQANLYLAFLYSKIGDLDNAIRSYEEVLRLRPDNYSVRFSLAVMYERKNEDELALAQYQKIINEAENGVLLERARNRIDAVKDRISPLTSSMAYRLATGETIDENGTISTSFSSVFNVGLDLAYKPIKPLSLIGRFGTTYSGNHTNETDTFAPTLGFNALLNYEDAQLAGGIQYTEIEGLLLEDQNGTSTSAFAKGLVRFDNPFDIIKLMEEKQEERQYKGITSMTRRKAEEIPERRKERPPLDLANNPDLQKLLEAMQQEVKEEIRRHEVVKGDTLWDISAALLDDPWLWPEIWQANPNIENPHLIFPGDTITLVYINGRPKLLLQRPGLEPEIPSVEDGMKLYQEAVKLVRMGKYAEALVRLEKILDYITNDLKTNLVTAMALQGLKRYDEAETYYRKVLELDPGFGEARFMLADMYEESGRLKNAIAELEELIASSKDELLVRDATEKLVALYHDYAFALVDALQTAKADESAGMIREAVRSGVRLYELNAHDQARDVFEKLTTWVPENADSHYWLAKIEMEYGEYDRAIEHLQISVSLEPDNDVYHEELAVLLEQMNDIDLSREQYMLIAQTTSSESQADWAMKHVDMLLALQAVRDQNFDQAIGIYEDLMKNYPDDANIAARAGELYLSTGDLDSAEKVYARALDLDKNNPEVAMGLLRVYAVLGDQAKLEATAKQMAAMELTQEQRVELRRQLGFDAAIAQINSGEYSAALERLTTISDIMGDDPLVMLNIAILHQALGEYDQAERIMLDLLDREPGNLTVRLHLGLLYAEMDRIDEAIAEFRTVISMGAGTEAEQPARDYLAVMREKQEQKFRDLEAGEPVPKNLSLTLSYNNFEPSGISYANSLSYAADLSFFLPLGDFGNWSFSYTRTINENEHIWGTDYAYVSDEYGVDVSRPVLTSLFSGLYGSLSLSQTKYHYDNIDTNALYALGRAVKRENVRDVLRASLTYRLHPQLSIIFSYFKSSNRSNLPLGRIYVILPTFPTPIAATPQSTTLGDFDAQSLAITVRLRF